MRYKDLKFSKTESTMIAEDTSSKMYNNDVIIMRNKPSVEDKEQMKQKEWNEIMQNISKPRQVKRIVEQEKRNIYSNNCNKQ